MELTVKFDSIDEALIALQAVQKMGNAADVNGDDSGASKHGISVTQDAQEVNSEDISDIQPLSDVETVEKILDQFGLKLAKGKSGSSTNVVGCFVTVMKVYRRIGKEKFEFEFYILSAIWKKYGGKRFDKKIIVELADFIDCYYGMYPLIDADRLRKQLTTAGRGSKTVDPYTPDMFLESIKTMKISGEATLTRYNFGYTDGQRLSENRLYTRGRNDE